MARLHLTVEGPTEQAFAAALLRPHLANHGVYVCRIELAAHAKKKGEVHRGGLRRYLPFRNDVLRRLKEDKSGDVFLSTMIDLYGLPNDFPKSDASKSEQDPYRRVEAMERALATDIGNPRFLPYLQLHEFEAILFADASKIADYYDRHVREVEQLRLMAAGVGSPELIDDGQQTAPSKRIASLIPAYAHEKPTAGPLIAAAIGLSAIRSKCPHFDAWLRKLETLGQNPQ
jgi:hypothetical protein